MRKSYLKRIWSIMMVLISIFILIVGSRILEIHLAERNWIIKKDEFINSSANHLYSLWKFQSSMALYQNEIDQVEFDKQSFESHYLLNLSPDDIKPFQSSSALDNFSLLVINLFRTVTFKTPLPNAEESIFIYKLYGAVYLIINSQFEEARLVLTKLLDEPGNQRYLDQIHLHIGFCSSMIGDEEHALATYQYIIDRYKNSPKTTKARRLIFELKLRQQEIQKLDADLKISNLKQLATLNSCDQVLDYAVDNQSNAAKSKIFYAKGICNFESGEKKLASHNISKSLFYSPNIEAAKEANRKLFLVSRNDEDLKNSFQLSVDVNKILKDSALTQFNKIQAKNSFNLNVAKAHSNSILSEYDLNSKKESQPESPLTSEVILNKIQSLTTPVKSKSSEGIINKNSMIRVSTINGRNFKGRLLSSPGASIIKLKTLVGVMRIPKSQINHMKLIY